MKKFPFKLHELLACADKSMPIMWLSHGRAFIITDEDKFVQEIVPMYFKQTKIRSFYRQLIIYGASNSEHCVVGVVHFLWSLLVFEANEQKRRLKVYSSISFVNVCAIEYSLV
jgi:hypothetical protein